MIQPFTPIGAHTNSEIRQIQTRKSSLNDIAKLLQDDATLPRVKELALNVFNEAKAAELCSALNGWNSELRARFFSCLEEGAITRKNFSIAGAKWIHDEPYNLAWVIKKMPDLEFLIASNNPLLNDDDLASIGALQKLTYLNLHQCHEVTGEGLEKLSIALKALHLGECSSLVGSNLTHLSRLSHLECLNLAKNKQIADVDLTFLEQTPLIKDLIVNGCEELTSEAFVYAASLKKLETFDFSDCPNLSDYHFKAKVV